MNSPRFRLDLPVPSDEVKDRASDATTARHEAFVQLLSSNYHAIYRFIVSLVGNIHTADDLMQDCSLLLWRKFDEFNLDDPDPERAFFWWARAFTHNQVRNFSRLQRNHGLIFEADLLSQIASTTVAAEELLEIRKDALGECMEKLPAAERRLLDACYAHGSTIGEAATRMRRTPNSVYKSLRRIRRKLYECINRQLGLKGQL